MGIGRYSRNQILYQTFDNPKRDVSHVIMKNTLHVTMKTLFCVLPTNSDVK